MIGSSGNSGGVVVGALVCGTECSGFKSRSILSFSLVKFFSKFSRAIPARSQYSMLHLIKSHFGLTNKVCSS